MGKKSKLQSIRERFYLPADWTKAPLFLEGVEFHHLVNVCRGQIGDHVAVVDGRGGLAEASIVQIDKKRATLELSTIERQPSPATTWVLAQGLPRINRLDFIVEKGTELGMSELWLFPGDRSERKDLSLAQMERLENICIAAMKQCGRLYLPKIQLLPPIQEWDREMLPLLLPLFYGDLSDAAPAFHAALRPDLNQKGAIFCTGPESGFTDTEEAALKAIGASGVKLHDHTLRTETASLVALTLMTSPR